MPQPEELPSDERMLTPADHILYGGQPTPFLAFLGFKSSTYGDLLEIQSREFAFRLASVRQQEAEAKDYDEEEWRSMKEQGYFGGELLIRSSVNPLIAVQALPPS